MQNVKKSLSIKFLASFTLLFLLFGLVSNFILKRKEFNVYANSTYTSATFNSSNLILTRLGYSSKSTSFAFNLLKDEWIDEAIYFNFSFKLDYDSSTDQVDFYVKGLYDSAKYLYDSTGTNANDTFCNVGNFNYSTGLATNKIVKVRVGSSTYYTPILFNLEYFNNDTNLYEVPLNSSIRPTLVINQIIFGNYTDFNRMNFATNSLFTTKLTDGHYNFISLVDSLGFRFTYFIPVCNRSTMSLENAPGNYLTYREYYTKNAINLGDNSAYQQGYNDGYNNGIDDGNGQGYKEGYSAGETIGYNNGYTAGVENGGNYTFASLLGAVVDVPVKTFTNLFNFELLGVNLAGFFSGLLTLAVILTIVRLIKGG